ncbi:MAG: carboxypeptidase-like regulatory domain-containing protein, partial [Candidatus Aminicenantes bacterium]
EGLGFKDFKKDNIKVEKGKTTEININLDLTNITGIEGFVTDAAGVQVEGADISFTAINTSDDDTLGPKAFTNKDGYYKLTGMPEGKYFIIYYYSTKKGRVISNEYGYLDIKKNVLLHLDLQFEKTIAEMEKK